MRRPILTILGLALTGLAASAPLPAATFTRTPIAPELDLDALTRDVARARLGRELFVNPYATVTIARTDLYDRFPYVETRHFQVVSDPRWNRLVYGERGRSLAAFDGRGTAFGALSAPRGLAVDEQGRLYVADTGHDRVLVFETVTEQGALTLVPSFAIGGLSGPYDVAHSDAGTPFTPGDDLLYVADTGRNQVLAFALEPGGARRLAATGELGSGAGRFAGPMAIAAGRDERGHTGDVYVADAHNRRIVRLRHAGGSFAWAGEVPQAADLVTALDTDAWGNVYASAPRAATVRKYAPDLAPVDALDAGLAGPRAFHLPFLTVHDHRDGSRARVGQPSALSVDDWRRGGGIALWALGIDVRDLRVDAGAEPVARFTLTDRAQVAIEVRDAASGAVLARRAAGPLAAGAHALPIAAELAAAAGRAPRLRVVATSSYAGGATATAEAALAPAGSALPARATLLGNAPNPAAPVTRIAFVLPAGARQVSLQVFDAGGRRVRDLGAPSGPGLHEVPWDGADDRGHAAMAGVYFYRLDVDGARFTRRLVLVR